MTELDRATLKHILTEYQFDVPRYTWEEKGKVLFRLKAKYGDAFNDEAASKVYDEIVNPNPPKEKQTRGEDAIDVELWEEQKRISKGREE